MQNDIWDYKPKKETNKDKIQGVILGVLFFVSLVVCTVDLSCLGF